MKKRLLSNIILLIGVIIGGISGYTYYYYIGCPNGTCSISSNPYKSVIYFAIWFGIVSGIIQSQVKESKIK